MRSTKKLFTLLLLLCLCLQALTATSAQAAAADWNEKALTLKWLGTAGWEIQIGQTVILIDPFLTRGLASAGKEWKTDEEAVLKAIKRADYIFAGHSHADHIADIPSSRKNSAPRLSGPSRLPRLSTAIGVP